MRKLFAFLARPIVWSTASLLLLLLALHVVCPLLRIAEDQRWIIELLVGTPLAVLLVGYWLRQYLIERRLTGDMAAQAKKQASLQGPDALRDFKAFSEEFKSAFAQLNQVCRERGQLGGAAALPWIMILGPSGVGKSTALERSGLRFVSLGRRLQGIGGTRNCTWWLASDAVFLDTAGRYAVRDEDRDEWRAFLQLLRRRRQRPIDAVLLQVGIDEILDRPRAEVERAALQLRERLDELLHLLDARIPVHLLFNKCDLLDGFTSFFGSLDEQEKAQPWGFRLDTSELLHQSIGEAFQQRFGDLIRVLTQRTTARLLTLSDRDAREAAMAFPSELAATSATLRFFVETVFEARARTERPWLCAIHLGSAEQPGQHLIGMRQKRAEELGLPHGRRTTGLQPAMGNGGETMFLRGVFAQVLRQAELSARPSAARQMRLRLHQKVAVAAGLALCFLGSLYLGGSYTHAMVWMSQLQDQCKRMLQAESLPVVASRVSKEELTAELGRQEAVRELLQEAPSGVPSGPAQQASVLLRRRIDHELLLPLKSQMQTDLDRAAQRQQDGPGEDYTRGFGMLRLLHVLRGNSCEGTEPEPTRQSLSQFVLEHWQRALGENARFLRESSDEEDPQRPQSANLRLRQQLNFYFEQEPSQLRDSSQLQFEESLREQTRVALASGGGASVIFNLRASLSNLYERDRQLQSPLFAEPGIERVFTKRGCSVFFSAEASRDSNWWKCVLHVPVPKDPPNLEDMYREHYAQAWNTWLHELKLRPVTPKPGATPRKDGTGLGEVIEKLDALVRDARPALPEVMQTVGKGFDLAARRAKQNQTKRTWYSGCGKSVGKSIDWGRESFDQIKTPGQCKSAMELLAPLSQLASKEKSQNAEGTEAEDGGIQEDYKKYTEAVKAFRATLYRVEKSTERTGEALKLVQATMAGSGDLWTLHTARDTLLGSLHARLSNGGFDLQESGLQASLRDLEGMAWQALLPLAARALNDQWKSQVYSPWSTLKGNQQRQLATDEERCKGRTDFLRDKLTGFVDKSIAMFFVGNSILDCNQKRMSPPFEPALPFLAGTCGQLRDARRVGAEVTDCPKALGAGGGAPKRDIQSVDVIPPKTAGCNKDADEVTLDRGDKVFVCQVSTGNCAESKLKSSQRAVLRVKWKESPNANVVLQTDYPDDLFQKAQVAGSTLRFSVPTASAPGHCEGYVIRFTLAPAGGGGGAAVPKKADDRWRSTELPESLVSLQR